MTEAKTPKTPRASAAADVKAGPGTPDSPGAVPATTDPAGVTDQAKKTPAAKAEAAPKPDRSPDGDAGINAHLTDAIPGRDPKPEIDPDDPGINASVVS
jgi:hypothetical protein